MPCASPGGSVNRSRGARIRPPPRTVIQKLSSRSRKELCQANLAPERSPPIENEMASHRYRYRGRASIRITVWRPVRVSIQVSVPVPNPVPVAPSVPISVAVAVRILKARPIECHRDIELMKAGQFPFTKTVREVRFECPTIPEKGIVRISLCSSSPSKALDGDDSGHVTVDHDPPGRALPRNRTIYHLSINPSIHLSIDRSIIYHYLCMTIESMSTQCLV